MRIWRLERSSGLDGIHGQLSMVVADIRQEAKQGPQWPQADSLYCLHSGGVAEWLKAAVLKTVNARAFVGSNPTASASFA